MEVWGEALGVAEEVKALKGELGLQCDQDLIAAEVRQLGDQTMTVNNGENYLQLRC